MAGGSPVDHCPLLTTTSRPLFRPVSYEHFGRVLNVDRAFPQQRVKAPWPTQWNVLFPGVVTRWLDSSSRCVPTGIQPVRPCLLLVSSFWFCFLFVSFCVLFFLFLGEKMHRTFCGKWIRWITAYFLKLVVIRMKDILALMWCLLLYRASIPYFAVLFLWYIDCVSSHVQSLLFGSERFASTISCTKPMTKIIKCPLILKEWVKQRSRRLPFYRSLTFYLSVFSHTM